MREDLKASLAWSGGLIGLALAATVARQLGYIDAETVERVVLGAIGLMVAWYGNRAPKAFVPNRRARRVNRVSGWSMALSGLVYAGLWAFAPTSIALAGGTAAVAAGIAITVVYCLSLRREGEPA